MTELEKLRGQEFRGVEELAAAAGSLIEHYSKEPARGNVRLGITPRIVRHYLSEALLGAPTRHSGPAILFNYGNLLRLLAVKKLLADHWSVFKIREFMAALDVTALEQLVKGAFTSTAETRLAAQRKAESSGETAKDFRVTQPRLKNPLAESSHTPSMSLATVPPPPLASLAMESMKRSERASAEWIEIATGLEIKVRRSFRPPRNEHERERLTERFWSVITGKRSEK
jgi:DNA-binding transcriptional MerR regulator